MVRFLYRKRLQPFVRWLQLYCNLASQIATRPSKQVAISGAFFFSINRDLHNIDIKSTGICIKVYLFSSTVGKSHVKTPIIGNIHEKSNTIGNIDEKN